MIFVIFFLVLLKNWCLFALLSKLVIFPGLELKLKNIHHVLEFNQSQLLKPYVQFNTHKNRLINNSVYGKKMENLRSRNDKRLVRNKKNYLKKTSKPSYMAQKNT